MIDILYIGIGAVAGFIIGLFIFRRRKNRSFSTVKDNVTRSHEALKFANKNLIELHKIFSELERE